MTQQADLKSQRLNLCPALVTPAGWFWRPGARVRAPAGGRFVGGTDTATGRGQESRVSASAQGGAGLGRQRTKPGLAVHSEGASLPGRGQARGSWLGPDGPFPDLPTGRKWGCLGGRTALGRGAPFTESPGSKLRWAGGCFLKLWKEQTDRHGVPGSLPNPKLAPWRMLQEGRSTQHMESPASSTLLGEAAPLHSLPFPFPFCSLRCLPGTGVPMAWLCVASSSGHLGHRNPCPQAVTACGERHRDRR